MSGLNDKYNQILLDIEEHISNEDEKKYVVEKVEKLSSLYMDLVDRITRMDDERIEKLEEKQEKIINVLSKLQESVNLIKSDIYEDDNYDFEIVCPYCNHEFVADIESELKEEIECPECHNIIELDWDGEEENSCSACHGGHCSSCGIVHEHEEDEDNDEDIDNIDDNEDDM
ncbi:MAG: hypothetical protein ACLTXD_01120 [Clostridia bacterium]